MAKLFFLTWVSILYVALSLDSSRHCAPTCSTCYHDDHTCSNVTCSDFGSCKRSIIHDNCGCCLVCAKQEGESCAGPYGAEGFCDTGLKCSVSEKRAVAGKVDEVGICKDIFCFRDCANARQTPVCGSDGKWYKSLCELRKLRCTTAPHLKEVSNTICERNMTLCDTICNDTRYSPVCGTDKKVYYNKCKLRKAACSSRTNIKVASSTALCSNNPIIADPCSLVKCTGQGEKCVIVDSHEQKTDQPFAECQCVTVRDHCSTGITVCGSNNKKYRSKCHMDAEACATKQKITAVECTRLNGSGLLPYTAQPSHLPTKTSDPFHDQQISRR